MATKKELRAWARRAGASLNAKWGAGLSNLNSNDEAMSAAIKAVQKANGLKETGLADNATMKAIEAGPATGGGRGAPVPAPPQGEAQPELGPEYDFITDPKARAYAVSHPEYAERLLNVHRDMAEFRKTFRDNETAPNPDHIFGYGTEPAAAPAEPAPTGPDFSEADPSNVQVFADKMLPKATEKKPEGSPVGLPWEEEHPSVGAMVKSWAGIKSDDDAAIEAAKKRLGDMLRRGWVERGKPDEKTPEGKKRPRDVLYTNTQK